MALQTGCPVRQTRRPCLTPSDMSWQCLSFIRCTVYCKGMGGCLCDGAPATLAGGEMLHYSNSITLHGFIASPGSCLHVAWHSFWGLGICITCVLSFHLFDRCPFCQLPSLFLLSAIVAIHTAMLSASKWKSLRHTLLVLFTATLLIGVTLLAISSEINPVGFFFLAIGVLCLIGYLISVAVEQYLKHQNPVEENHAAERRQSLAQ